ncbi:MAG: SDR family oxidoreductase [Chloroflexota bacterium]|nr:SDR family oxidoreductase [Chloroflexota bacterium]
MGLEGRVALVTGAGGEGMGRSIALTLARDGADIVLNYHRKSERSAETMAAIEAMGRQVLSIAADIADPSAVDAMVAAAHERFGRIDVLVNSAGGPWKPQDITEIDPANLRAVLANEIESVYYLLRAVLPGMRERGWGRVISIGGNMADDWRFGPPDAPLDYPLGKAARHWITRTLAPRELPRGITINAVAPGPTDRVPLQTALAAVHGERGDAAAGNTPQDIADVVSFLCSDAASRVTGAVIPVPGARTV